MARKVRREDGESVVLLSLSRVLRGLARRRAVEAFSPNTANGPVVRIRRSPTHLDARLLRRSPIGRGCANSDSRNRKPDGGVGWRSPRSKRRSRRQRPRTPLLGTARRPRARSRGTYARREPGARLPGQALARLQAHHARLAGNDSPPGIGPARSAPWISPGGFCATSTQRRYAASSPRATPRPRPTRCSRR